MKSSTPPHWNDTNFHINYPGSPYKNSHTIELVLSIISMLKLWRELISPYNITPESNIKVARIIEMITN